MGGRNEDVFISHLEAGKLARKLGHSTKDVAAEFQVARDTRPVRAEPLYELAVLYREKGQFEKAYKIALEGSTISIPDDLVFVALDVYQWRLLEELAIAAHILGRHPEAIYAYEEILTRIEQRSVAISSEDSKRITGNLTELKKKSEKL
jgi:tetratricopeptide (TPR) repeat protein